MSRACRAAQKGQRVLNIGAHSSGLTATKRLVACLIAAWAESPPRGIPPTISIAKYKKHFYKRPPHTRTGSARCELNAAVAVRLAHIGGQAQGEHGYHECGHH